MTDNKDRTFLDRALTFDWNGFALECGYVFQPGPEFAVALQTAGPEAIFYFQVDAEGHANCCRLSGDTNGWCVKVGKNRVYLLIGEDAVTNDEKTMARVKNIHNQLMKMRVYYPAYEDILAYWQKPADALNQSELYLQRELIGRSEYLGNLIRVHCPHAASALEVGCNVGRNLNYLNTEFGFQVAGIEISEYAAALQEKTYPALRGIPLHIGAAQDLVSELDDKQFDLVFSMAVLMHMHPETPEQFWADLVRIAGRYIITIENETGGTERHWGRNYQEIFEPLGARQLHAESVPTLPNDEGGIENYISRVFEVAP